MGDPRNACILLSESCTTSWFDWIHGELWLCPNGLLRRSLGIAATFVHRNRRTVDPTDRPTRSFTTREIEGILTRGRRNRWITWTSISHATLKRGVLDSSLHLELSDGRREKFLWLRIDGGYNLLQEALARRLPGRYEARDPF